MRYPRFAQKRVPKTRCWKCIHPRVASKTPREELEREKTYIYHILYIHIIIYIYTYLLIIMSLADVGCKFSLFCPIVKYIYIYISTIYTVLMLMLYDFPPLINGQANGPRTRLGDSELGHNDLELKWYLPTTTCTISIMFTVIGSTHGGGVFFASLNMWRELWRNPRWLFSTEAVKAIEIRGVKNPARLWCSVGQTFQRNFGGQSW